MCIIQWRFLRTIKILRLKRLFSLLSFFIPQKRNIGKLESVLWCVVFSSFVLNGSLILTGFQLGRSEFCLRPVYQCVTWFVGVYFERWPFLHFFFLFYKSAIYFKDLFSFSIYFFKESTVKMKWKRIRMDDDLDSSWTYHKGRNSLSYVIFQAWGADLLSEPSYKYLATNLLLAFIQSRSPLSTIDRLL